MDESRCIGCSFAGDVMTCGRYLVYFVTRYIVKIDGGYRYMHASVCHDVKNVALLQLGNRFCDDIIRMQILS